MLLHGNAGNAGRSDRNKFSYSNPEFRNILIPGHRTD